MLKEKTLEEFLKELASESPTPGGGSVAALSGALAAGLCSMVGKLSENVKARECGKKAEKLKKVFIKLIDEDAKAFNEVMKAYHLPKTTSEEKKKRAKEIEKTLKYAVEIPLQTARCSYEGLKLAESLMEKANPNTLSDLGTAALLAEASIESALLNVKINLTSIKDGEFKKEINEAIKKFYLTGSRTKVLVGRIQSKIINVE